MSPDAQRDHDVFGFAYFEHVEEIFKWDKKKVDELHKANTPLLRRPDIPDTMHPEAKCKVMVMHDYRGNYLDSGYESTQGAISPRKDYVMEYWQRVEVFNYFTHHRVSIPPPAWINTAHRNGTRILGTFTIEGYKEDDEGRVLETWPGTDRYKLAEALVDMAKCYGFDGWLMNFETVFVKNTDWNDGASLLKLLGQVRVGLEEIKGKIIWYDALNTTNSVGWQNELNGFNEPFMTASGSMVTNYAYGQKMLVDSVIKAKGDKLSLENLYMGIDCWGQTDDMTKKDRNAGKFETRRTVGFNEIDSAATSGRGTGHGGTATGLAMQLMAKAPENLGNETLKKDAEALAKEKGANFKPERLGVGFFAQGWAYEHFMPGTAVDRFMWEGTPNLLPYKDPSHEGRLKPDDIKAKNVLRETGIGWQAEFDCACIPSIAQHLREDIPKVPIKRFARQWPAGSTSFFHSDYTEPVVHLGSGQYLSQLGQQSVLPAPGERFHALTFQDVLASKTATGYLRADMGHDPSRCALRAHISDVSGIGDTTKLSVSLELHKLNLDGSTSPELWVYYRHMAELSSVTIQLYADIPGKDRAYFLLDGAADKYTRHKFSVTTSAQDRVTAIGVSVQGPAKSVVAALKNGAAELLDIYWITIKPQAASYPDKITLDAAKVKLVHKDGMTTGPVRLKWEIPTATPTDKMPWSAITNHFSHFVVTADKEKLGTAYALAFVIDPARYAGWRAANKTSVEFGITGYSFDGLEKATFTGQLALIQ